MEQGVITVIDSGLSLALESLRYFEQELDEDQ